MSHTPNELSDAFPQDHAVLHQLKLDNAHFAALAEKYHEVNRAIHRIETEIEPASDEHTEMMKKQRLALVDEIGAIIAEARTADA
jgi:uncharacterized protein